MKRSQSVGDCERRWGSCIVWAQLALWRVGNISQSVSVPAYSAPRIGITPRHPRGVLAGFCCIRLHRGHGNKNPGNQLGSWKIEVLRRLRWRAGVCVYLWQHLHAVTHLMACTGLTERPCPAVPLTHITSSFHRGLQWAVAAVNAGWALLLFNMELEASKHTLWSFLSLPLPKSASFCQWSKQIDDMERRRRRVTSSHNSTTGFFFFSRQITVHHMWVKETLSCDLCCHTWVTVVFSLSFRVNVF